MSSVFDDMSLKLGLAARWDRIRDLVAKAILDCAHQGIHDPASMRDCQAAADRLTSQRRAD